MTSTLKPPDSEMPQILYVGWDGDRMEYFADSTPPPIDPDYPHAEYVRSPSPSKGMPTREEMRARFEKETGDRAVFLFNEGETSPLDRTSQAYCAWLESALSERDATIQDLRAMVIELNTKLVLTEQASMKAVDAARTLRGELQSLKELPSSTPGVESFTSGFRSNLGAHHATIDIANAIRSLPPHKEGEK